MYLITMEIELDVNICQRWSRKVFNAVCDFVSMKAKSYVFCLFRVFFPLFLAKFKCCFMPLPHVTRFHTRFQDLSSFPFCFGIPPFLPLSQYVLFKSWIWERGRLSHCLYRKLLLRSCPFSWCTVLSKLNKKCETLAGKSLLDTVLISTTVWW